MLRFRSLGSGSSGNATVVEAHGSTRVTRLLVDCGFGLSHLDARLAAAGLQADQIDAIFITHEHGDHAGCLTKLLRRERIPVWMSHGTHQGMGAPELPGLLRIAQDAVGFEVAGLQVCPFTVPHDAREPLQLCVSDGRSRLGILTDLGHATAHVQQQLALCHGLLLECNHDPDLLARSSYPAFLKQRVGGRYGHLSNPDAAALALSLHHGALKHLVAAHLSQQNNRPELARAALAHSLGCQADDFHVADAAHGTPWLEL